MTHDVAILAGAGLRLIRIDHQIVWAIADLLRHERPFEAGRKAGAASSAQAGILDLVDNGVAALLQDRLGAVPGAAGASADETPVAATVEITKDAILVVEHRLHLA